MRLAVVTAANAGGGVFACGLLALSRGRAKNVTVRRLTTGTDDRTQAVSYNVKCIPKAQILPVSLVLLLVPHDREP